MRKSYLIYLVSSVILIGICLSVFSCSSNDGILVISDFEQSIDNWEILGNQEGSEPSYNSTGGYPGGCLSQKDNKTHNIWYWSVSDTFLKYFKEDGSYNIYGKYIKYDLKHSDISPQSEAFIDFIITGKNNKCIFYDYSLDLLNENYPKTEWTAYSIPLSTDITWKSILLDKNSLTVAFEDNIMNSLKNAKTATEEDIKEVLNSVTGIYIRGDYLSDDNDIGYLDNFRITK